MPRPRVGLIGTDDIEQHADVRGVNSVMTLVGSDRPVISSRTSKVQWSPGRSSSNETRL